MSTVDNHPQVHSRADRQLRDSCLLPLTRTIEQSTGNRRGRCWNIFAWRGGETLFIESKQRSNDRIRPAQASWLEHALENGGSLSSFLIAEYVIDRGPV